MLAATKPGVGSHCFTDWVNHLPWLGVGWYVYKMGILKNMVSDHRVLSHRDVGLNASCHSQTVWAEPPSL